METKKFFQFHRAALWRAVRVWLPSRGTVLFAIALVAILFFTNRAGAFPFLAPTATSTSVISYQGRLTDSAGAPLTGAYDMVFRFYTASSGGSPLWSESWTDVQVTNGLFNVMLGSITTIPQSVVTSNANLWLGVKVGTDNEMMPRVQLGSVPFATQALTVTDGSITTAKIANLASEASRIVSWQDDTEYAIDNAAGPTSETVDPGIGVTVPTGKAYYYLVTYNGRFTYRFNERVGSNSGFFAGWYASLLANDTPVTAEAQIVNTGYRYTWAALGDSDDYWNAPYQATWIIRLTEGTYNLKLNISGHSDNTMDKARYSAQRIQVMRVY